MLEYESVLTRPEHLAASGVSREDVSAVLDELASVGKRVELMIRTRPTLPDPNDEMVLETAINGRADAIVTLGLWRRVLAEARKAAESEGVALNQLITLALAEKVSAKPRGLRGQPGQPPPRRMRPSKSASAWNLIRMEIG